MDTNALSVQIITNLCHTGTGRSASRNVLIIDHIGPALNVLNAKTKSAHQYGTVPAASLATAITQVLHTGMDLNVLQSAQKASRTGTDTFVLRAKTTTRLRQSGMARTVSPAKIITRARHTGTGRDVINVLNIRQFGMERSASRVASATQVYHILMALGA